MGMLISVSMLISISISISISTNLFSIDFFPIPSCYCESRINKKEGLPESITWHYINLYNLIGEKGFIGYLKNLICLKFA